MGKLLRSSRFKATVASLLLITIPFSMLLRENPPTHDDDDDDDHPRTINRHQDRITSSHRESAASSTHFTSRLRAYERQHKRCEPRSRAFDESLSTITTSKKNSSNPDVASSCRYIVFTPVNGLGNRILSLASAFLYALLTNRTLLVDFGPHMADLFREPFPNSTWLLPGQEPGQLLNLLKKQHHQANESAFSVLDIPYWEDNYDEFFFRGENQNLIQSAPWLILNSDQYFVPYLFLMPCFRPELDKLFPDRETVFHQLGKYLFRPSNQAWSFISTFYKTFLSEADERIGIQIRVFNDSRGKPTPLVMKQILSCIQKQGILNETGKNRAVLVASLSGDFYRELKENLAGVEVYQASQEESQRSEDGSHNMKAWVDMFLLSMCDVLVTSAWSTFGYVAQGLGGLKPWILPIPDIGGSEEAECRRTVSSEPCFHNPPGFDRPEEEGVVSPVVRCEDVGQGMKLVNQQRRVKSLRLLSLRA